MLHESTAECVNVETTHFLFHPVKTTLPIFIGELKVKLQTSNISILFIIGLLCGCASDNDSEKFFRRSADGENRVPFGGRSECLPYENYTPPDDCPDE